ncbi:PREDICTED: uncharacterized protein LOC104800214 [Tarenaya hassleriana]|uniref:uncharacterized protein LOC104800214 n=1 Tax=Tarenaya hassleriana TaxID=28532 RepID=UPI00053C19FD|nr:PREDICTED: uncharacterized protein LOC104800214 [Tarenaya hassleriana]
MAITDDSFKRPGAVPFSWEIRPGVPKTPSPHPDNLNHLRLSSSPQPLHPPPPPPALSERWLLLRPNRVRPGCFPPSLFRLRKSRRKTVPRLDPEYGSDTETVSSRRSIFPMWDSPKSLFSSNSFSSISLLARDSAS